VDITLFFLAPTIYVMSVFQQLAVTTVDTAKSTAAVFDKVLTEKP
jgi:hypothetical protein